MRTLLVGLIYLIGLGLNIAMVVHIFTSWMASALPVTLVAIFAVYFVPMLVLLEGRKRLKTPRAPSQRPKKPQGAARAPQVPDPLPAAPQRPQQRAIAVPPTIGQANPFLAPRAASMSPQLRRLVSEGDAEIIKGYEYGYQN